MYLKRIYDENVGPFEKLDIELSFSEDGNPKPTIFVGKTVVENLSFYQI